MRFRLLITLSLSLNSVILSANSGGDQAFAQILSLPIATTVCPTSWPFGLLTTGVVILGGGATSSTTTSGISSSSSTTTTVDLNRGQFPFSGENFYEKLDDWQGEYRKGDLSYRLIGGIKVFFLSEEDIESWDDFWARRAERKQEEKNKKKAKKEEKKKRKKKHKASEKESSNIVCQLPSDYGNGDNKATIQVGDTIEVPCFEAIQK
ncbi:MAG: hypothetical protein BWZ03_00848 [bacterium ADurb.BinA186]|nr:MAG: hypothetical protein BWZ03_00848 [bacterium ADurb.BinA186]